MNGPKQNQTIKILWIIIRIILGVTFIYASIDKILNPEHFAYAISNYKLLPKVLVNLCALILPWLELTLGVFLIFGFYEWASLTLFNILMLIFITAISISLIRGLNIACGCFTSDPNAEKMTWMTFSRDSILFLLGLAAYLLLYRLNPPPFCSNQ